MSHANPVPAAAPIRRVVIAGGGTAGWMAAAALSRTLGKHLHIVLVESDEISTVGVGESTIPPLVGFHRLLDINEQAFMAATQATIKLGIRFEGWRHPGHHYFHAFGVTGKDHWTAGFQHFWLKGRERGLAGDYGDYCLELQAARECRFAHLPHDGMNYAFHMDAGLYARFLRKFSEGYGVRRVEGKIVEVSADREQQRIHALQLASGERIEGDLFIDCTGFRGLLIQQALGATWEDWSQYLPCDSAVAVQTAATGEPLPYTRAIAHEAGWRWRIPLQHRVGNGLVYASRFMEDDSARRILLAHVDGQPLTEPRVIRFRSGHRHDTWRGNCIAMGLAGGFLEPLESTSIHLIQRGVLRLLRMFPTAGICPTTVDEYNRQTRTEAEHIRDFIMLHYHATERDDTPFWRGCHDLVLPDSLRHRIEMFREGGHLFRAPRELFSESSWSQVMLGQGIMPRQHHPSADLMGDAELSRFLADIRHGIERTIRQLPTHQAYLSTYCPAAPPVQA
ncbi:MAG TPA: tryptophan halogenase family protein [Rhodanobacter sp.]|nr:tryptophan halogenase family protein [Rhodanobacter sp.]